MKEKEKKIHEKINLQYHEDAKNHVEENFPEMVPIFTELDCEAIVRDFLDFYTK